MIGVAFIFFGVAAYLWGIWVLAGRAQNPLRCPSKNSPHGAHAFFRVSYEKRRLPWVSPRVVLECEYCKRQRKTL